MTKRKYNQAIYIECSPIQESPEKYYKQIIKKAGLPEKPILSKEMGMWGWDYNDIPEEEWLEKRKIVDKEMLLLYEEGFIAFGMC